MPPLSEPLCDSEPLERPELLPRPEEPLERPRSLCMPLDEPPLLRLGSLSQLSERPTFWPNSAEESLFCCPILEEVSRFTSPPEVDSVLRLSLSRSRFSITDLL